MTKEEEASKILTQYIDYDAETPDYYEMEKACKVAIKALEQEPCDCISRKAILSRFEHMNEVYTFASIGDLRKVIGDMPSIQPKTDVLDKIRAEIELNRNEWIKGKDAEWHTYDTDGKRLISSRYVSETAAGLLIELSFLPSYLSEEVDSYTFKTFLNWPSIYCGALKIRDGQGEEIRAVRRE